MLSVSRIRVTSVTPAFSQAAVGPSDPVANNPRGETILKAPAIINFDIPPEALVLAGGDARRIIVLRMPDDPLPTDKWTEVPCTAEGSTLACTTDRFSTWAMMVTPAPEVEAQATATTGTPPVVPRPAATGYGTVSETPSWPRFVGLVLLAGAVAGGAGYRARRRHAA